MNQNGLSEGKSLSNGSTSILVGTDTIKLSNDLIELDFNKNDGTLKGILNKTTGKQYLSGTDGGSWVLGVNAKTGDKWQAFKEDSVAIRGRGQNLTKINSEKIDDGAIKGIRLTFTHDLDTSIGGQTIKDLYVEQYVEIYEDNPFTSWKINVRNDSDDLTVITVNAPQVTTVKDENDNWSLVWPWKEGEIREGIVKRYIDDRSKRGQRISGAYPVPISMQWMAIYNDKEGLYYGVNDKTASFKEFNFGLFTDKEEEFDYDLKNNAVAPVNMSVTFYPFIGTKEAYTSPMVELGVGTEGNWYWAADRYRQWLRAESGWYKELPKIAAELTGWRPWNNMLYPGKLTAKYVSDNPGEIDYTRIISDVDSSGIDMLEMLGWHYNGFDSFYPDYKYLDEAGGREGLKKAIEEVHKQNDHIMFYINNHIADDKSEWFTSDDDNDGINNGAESMIVDGKGEGSLETYGNDRKFYAMCPSSELWINRMYDVAMDLRELGADGIWWDQLMEMPAMLCYNKEHGHSTPASTMPEGYATMMGKIQMGFAQKGGNFMFAAEGVTDFYSKYIDVNGMMWGRRLGYEEKQAPQTTRYVIPSKMLGLSGHKKSSTDKDEYAWAFTMGEPLLMNPEINSLVYPRYPDIYRSEPDIYFYGTYQDEKGISIDNENIKATSITASDGKSMGIQFRNTSADKQSTSIKVNLIKLGFNEGTIIESIVNIESKENIVSTLENGIFQFDLSVYGLDVAAYKVTLK